MTFDPTKPVQQRRGNKARIICLDSKNPDCPSRPSVQGGDVYDGGKDKAEDEMIRKWNIRFVEDK